MNFETDPTIPNDMTEMTEPTARRYNFIFSNGDQAVGIQWKRTVRWLPSEQRNNIWRGDSISRPGNEYVYIYTYILAISCPYSRAEHIPCQNSWEISGNCEDPFQVKFVFHTVCRVLLFFWHVRCRLRMFFPKDDPYFQQFLETS